MCFGTRECALTQFRCKGTAFFWHMQIKITPMLIKTTPECFFYTSPCAVFSLPSLCAVFPLPSLVPSLSFIVPAESRRHPSSPFRPCARSFSFIVPAESRRHPSSPFRPLCPLSFVYCAGWEPASTVLAPCFSAVSIGMLLPFYWVIIGWLLGYYWVIIGLLKGESANHRRTTGIPQAYHSIPWLCPNALRLPLLFCSSLSLFLTEENDHLFNLFNLWTLIIFE